MTIVRKFYMDRTIRRSVDMFLKNMYILPFLQILDDYFVSNIEKVDSVTLLRKDKVMNGVGWALRFTQSVNTWPCLNDLGAAGVSVCTIVYVKFNNTYIVYYYLGISNII